MFGLGAEQLRVWEARSGRLLWSASAQALARLPDLDGDGVEEAAALLARSELSARSGASGASVWTRRVDQQLFAALPLLGVALEDARRLLCVHGLNASTVVSQCWAPKDAQTVERRSAQWVGGHLALLAVFSRRVLLTQDCRFLRFDDAGVTTPLPQEEWPMIPKQFAHCRPRPKLPPLTAHAVARFRDGTLESFDKTGKLVFRMNHLLSCSNEEGLEDAKHSNLFSSAKKLILRAGIVCLAQNEGLMSALLLDGATGKIWQTVRLSGCVGVEAAVRLSGNTAVVLCRSQHGFQATSLQFFEDAPTISSVRTVENKTKSNDGFFLFRAVFVYSLPFDSEHHGSVSFSHWSGGASRAGCDENGAFACHSSSCDSVAVIFSCFGPGLVCVA